MKLSKSKKAIGKGEILVILILSMAIFIVLGASTYNWLQAAEKGTDIEICRDSVLINSKVGEKTLGQFQTALQCPASFVEMKSSERNKEIAKKDVISKIVKGMNDCWHKMGEGEAALFYNVAFLDRQLYCLVCSEFTIDRNIPIKDIEEYIKTQKTKTGEYYKDYFDTWYGDYGDEDETYWLKDHFFIHGNLEDSGIFYGESDGQRRLKKDYNARPSFEIKSEARSKLWIPIELRKDTKYTVFYMQRFDTRAWGGAQDRDFQTFIVTPTASITNQKCTFTYHETKKKK
jgi:hypothetical protein